ncbi:MAG TPA: hypothetical protein VFT70_18820 [Nocardioides sp.]|nr:hypothetical protein [Nocardioides sp.]
MPRLAALLAALAVVVLLGTGCDDGPAPARAAAATTVPWWHGGLLHVGGTTLATELQQIRYAGGTTLVGAADAEASRWSLVRDGRLVPLVSARSLVDPALSDDGRRVVWVQETGSRELRPAHFRIGFRVVSYDVGAGRPAGTWATHARVICCDATGYLVVEDVAGDGSVELGRVGHGRMRWVPGSDPVPLAGRGSWPGGRDGVRSPDGASVALLATEDGSRPPKQPRTVPWVRGHGRPVRLDAPAGARIVAWEDDDHVVLATGHLVRFLRCAAATGACEQTADRPGGRVRLPSAR